jgi:hypothetical protein
MKTIFGSTMLMFMWHVSIAQNRLDSLNGSWAISAYESVNTKIEFNTDTDTCGAFLILNFQGGKIKFIFTDGQDSAIFSGKISRIKNNLVRIKNNIHEIIYLDELEHCISASRRMDLRGIFYRTFNFSIRNRELSFYYSDPKNLSNIKSIRFVRR